jgi:hypothetical protein
MRHSRMLVSLLMLVGNAVRASDYSTVALPGIENRAVAESLLAQVLRSDSDGNRVAGDCIYLPERSLAEAREYLAKDVRREIVYHLSTPLKVSSYHSIVVKTQAGDLVSVGVVEIEGACITFLVSLVAIE